ncbi:hypothetical protein TIFTF001_031305 [Ficus carica]|uniref:Secreted protein n=1 Tax=Ficus carica TaxID=3494 RepID=A0AA88J649_FICCA|nr:hypothetical protein TIFTF001_031305 [Ficus carica]
MGKTGGRSHSTALLLLRRAAMGNDLVVVIGAVHLRWKLTMTAIGHESSPTEIHDHRQTLWWHESATPTCAQTNTGVFEVTGATRSASGEREKDMERES